MGDKNMAMVIAQDYIDNYLSHLKKDNLFTKENIKFLSGYTSTSREKSFWILFRNANKIDKVMLDSDYVESKLHFIISMEEIQPALDSASNSNTIPNWSNLSQIVKKKYNTYYSDRVLAEAKIRWYQFKKDWSQFCKYTIAFVDKYVLYSDDYELAERSWNVFLVSLDKEQLQTASQWTKRVITRNTDSTNILPNIIDTYANIIYKISYLFENKKHISRAIEEEARALSIAQRFNEKSKVEIFSKTIEKMKLQEPTWPQKL
jgi:hypothetical protein